MDMTSVCIPFTCSNNWKPTNFYATLEIPTSKTAHRGFSVVLGCTGRCICAVLHIVHCYFILFVHCYFIHFPFIMGLININCIFFVLFRCKSLGWQPSMTGTRDIGSPSHTFCPVPPTCQGDPNSFWRNEMNITLMSHINRLWVL